jgi:hypothetical protein
MLRGPGLLCRKTFNETRQNQLIMKIYVLNIMSVCMYSCLSFPECKTHMAYCHMRPVCLCHIFQHTSNLINGTIFLKNELLTIICVF